ncbi:LPXTG cell wall anchor domain-containing protein, partial [Lactobacillus mulieris]
PAESTKPVETKPAESTKPVETKPAESTKPIETKPAESTKPAVAPAQEVMTNQKIVAVSTAKSTVLTHRNIEMPIKSRVEEHYGKQLPQTGDNENVLAAIGSALAGLGMFVGFKRKKN